MKLMKSGYHTYLFVEEDSVVFPWTTWVDVVEMSIFLKQEYFLIRTSKLFQNNPAAVG